jgi:hypothetical protein
MDFDRAPLASITMTFESPYGGRETHTVTYCEEISEGRYKVYASVLRVYLNQFQVSDDNCK